MMCAFGEQVVGQAIMSFETGRRQELHYWYRDTDGATSEVDFILSSGGRLIPLEVKSGKTGKLRSLHRFMEESRCKTAYRICSGKPGMTNIKTQSGYTYDLVSLPFYLVSALPRLIAA